MTHLSIDIRLMAFKFLDLVVENHSPSFLLYAEKVYLTLTLLVNVWNFFICNYYIWHLYLENSFHLSCLRSHSDPLTLWYYAMSTQDKDCAWVQRFQLSWGVWSNTKQNKLTKKKKGKKKKRNRIEYSYFPFFMVSFKPLFFAANHPNFKATTLFFNCYNSFMVLEIY